MPRHLNGEEFFLLREVADEAQKSPNTIRRWMRDGKIDCQKRYENSSGKLLFTLREKQKIISYAHGVRRA